MKQRIFLAALAAFGLGLPLFSETRSPLREKAKEKNPLSFKILRHGNYGEASVTGDGSSGFSMTLKNTAKQNHAIAFANFNQNAAAQEKLIFRLKGDKSNGNAFLNVELLYAKGKEWITARSPTIPVRNGEFKNHVFGLDTDFKLGDGVYQLRQIKFVLNTDPNPPGSAASIRVEDVRIVSADELSASGTDFIVVPFPAPEKKNNSWNAPSRSGLSSTTTTAQRWCKAACPTGNFTTASRTGVSAIFCWNMRTA